MKYDFNEIEEKWQKFWAENQTFKAKNFSSTEEGEELAPKYYVLDMFPYPSGAGLHVGHPLGYIASDIYARYKRHKGFNVLHPQGYDSFGLPAEQYAIQTGQHPAVTTKENIARYREQLDKLGFSFDWSREVRTSDPDYYKWTQWIFIQLFDSWYDLDEDKAKPVSELEKIFTSEGNLKVNAACDADVEEFSAEACNSFSSEEKQRQLLKYRLTYLAETEVNWCSKLGTVLANDEIVNGVSERGGYPVVRKKMTQWSMRISAYAERLLQSLNKIDWTESLKESQRNWIGKSVGAEVQFRILPSSHPQPFPEGREQNNDNFLSFGESPGEDEKPGYLTGNPEISGELLHRAKEMRKNPTESEAILWSELKEKKIGVKFRRQHPIDNFIVDFVCLSKGLIVEIDGEIHSFQKQADNDRQLKLEQKLGYKVLRFTDNEVLKDVQSVINEIVTVLNSLSFGEGRGEDEPAFDKYDSSNPLEENEKNIASLKSSHPQPFPEGRERVQAEGEEKKVFSFGEDIGGATISVFTTRPDTIFGVTFMVLAPEHELVEKITTPEQKAEVEKYIEQTAKRSERERLADVKSISGAFTGAYAEHPFTKEPLPIWIGDYVLAGYGTGAVMAVPGGDQRDYDFAKHFDLPIINVFENADISEEAFSGKEGAVITNSDFLNGLGYKEALKKAISELEKTGLGKGKINYRLRDAVFSRQRYWGEPFPIYYVNGLPQTIAKEHLPLRLPEVEKYLPTETGEPPLGNAINWAWDAKNHKVVSNSEIDHKTIFPLELNTMPGWAGSSWYFFRYMDATNDKEFVSAEAQQYWENVDLYIGGSEHATGHLLYARFWTKFLKDRNLVTVDEPFKKLINQGMILGQSAFAHRIKEGFYDFENEEIDEDKLNRKISIFDDLFEYYFQNRIISFDRIENQKSYDAVAGKMYYVSKTIDNIPQDIVKEFEKQDLDIYKIKYTILSIHAPIEYVNLQNELDVVKFQKWNSTDFPKQPFYNVENVVKVSREVEKMSKSKYNVVNPDDICEDYGADTLRMYEMFLGPLEQAKPWNTAGITGVHNFLKKLWKLYHSGENENFFVSEEKPSADSLKSLHKTIKKVTEDIEAFSFNTSVSTFMICVNELSAQNCNQRQVLEPLCVLIAPYAPHVAEELWQKLGFSGSVSAAAYPVFEKRFLVENSKNYPISFNGKMRFTLELPLNLSKEEIEKIVLDNEKTQQQLGGKQPKKVIVVPGKIVNIVG